jgi:hypothetical protein
MVKTVSSTAAHEAPDPETQKDDPIAREIQTQRTYEEWENSKK